MKNKRFNYLTLAVLYFGLLVFIINYLKTSSEISIYSYIGSAIMVVSLVFFTLARIKLGSSFQVSAEANKLVKDGIYKVIRHPIYVFGFTFFVGLIIFTQVYYGFIALIILVALQMTRIKKEEKVLEETFGEEYLEYKKNTWF